MTPASPQAQTEANYVIGSGPAGIAAATALLERGERVSLLDAGGTLEVDRQERVASLSERWPEHWDPDEVEALRGELRSNPEGAPLKLVFGSDYPYRDVDRFLALDREGVDAYHALAEGGLSVLWGASILPYTERELRGWPIGSADLLPHYQAVLKMTGLSGEHDSLNLLYPLLVEPTANLRASSQANRLLRRMTAHQSQLESQGVFFGKARLAISQAQGVVDGCVHCGLCLYGCPYGLIYSSTATLRRLLETYPGFEYRPGFVVRKLSEHDRGVSIDAVERASRKAARFEASRVYLGAGVYGTTAIVLESLGARGVPITLRQSDHFLLLMRVPRESGLANERLHTLSQIFVELIDASLSEHAIHLQIYTHNDFYARMARQRLGRVAPAARMLDPLIERLVLVKGYLHSDDSSAIEATLEPNASPVLRLRTLPNPRSRITIRAVIELLRRNRRAIGASPLRFGLRVGRPGSGAHVGGSFPMSSRRREFCSDILGRPYGLSRVHVVDSSAFTTVPAPTITLTVMANAHRIASESAPGS